MPQQLICLSKGAAACVSNMLWPTRLDGECILNLLCRPDFTNTEPAVNIGPFPQWADKKKIVSMDPFGHLAPWLFRNVIESENGMSAGKIDNLRTSAHNVSGYSTHDR